MNFKNLELFLTVAKLGNISEASKVLHISQPAVSMQIKRLEEQYNIPLITSHSKGIKLTDAGEVFLSYAERIVLLYDQLERDVREFQDGKKGHIIIAGPDEIVTYILPKAIAIFLTENPDIEIEVRVANDSSIETLVKNGEIDLGFTFIEQIDHFTCRVNKFQHDQWILVSPIKRTNLKQLYVTEAFDLHIEGIEEMVKVVKTMENVKQAVLAGLGRGIVLKGAVQQELTLNQFRIDTIIEETQISMVTRPAEKIQSSLKLFLTYMNKGV